MINCVIIDDEEYALGVTRSFCKRIPYLHIIAEFIDSLDATTFIDKHKSEIDLVFLDIEMPRFSGIDFLRAYTFPNVILVTGHPDHALSSYEYGVVDYLLKPFSFERFAKAINKVYAKQQQEIEEMPMVRQEQEERDALYIKEERNKYTKIPHAIIKYIKGAKNYSVIQTTTAVIIAPLRLKDLAERLPANRFQRIHKSCIIHMEHFESLERNIIKMHATEEALQLGTAYRQDFLIFLNQQRLQ